MVDIKVLKQFSAGLSVLYVEDDLEIQMIMGSYLKKLFDSVVLASDGEEGLELCKKNAFDIIITDISLPKMDGSEMIAKIREFNEKVAILITTAHIDSNYLMEAIKAHVDGYIIKPFDNDMLNIELLKVSEKIQKFKENTIYKLHLKEQTKQMQENYDKTIYSIVELIEQRDTYTAGHSKRIAYYSTLIAQEMGCSDDDIRLLYQAAILHDLGKIETPDSVLLKPKKLNAIEYTLIQEHVSVGYKLLNNIPMFKNMAQIVYQHHERYNGKGYPNGIQKEEILPLSRILMVADSFDAMTTNRIYKGKKSIEEALQEIEELSSIQFHPEVVCVAYKALKNIKIEDNINQLPKTVLEEERFAYFYKDPLSELYNKNYLDVVLSENRYNQTFKYLLFFMIHNFAKFNIKHGWDKGDILLKEFANILSIHTDGALIFRIFGDDFVILSKELVNTTAAEKVLDELIQKNELTYTKKRTDLTKTKVSQLSDVPFLR